MKTTMEDFGKKMGIRSTKIDVYFSGQIYVCVAKSIHISAKNDKNYQCDKPK